MANLLDLRKKISTVQNTKKITLAMKMVSAAKMRKSQDKLKSIKPYAKKITEIFSVLNASLDNNSSLEFMKPRSQVKNILIITVSSSRGLCGAFNSNINKKSYSIISENSNKNVKFLPIGSVVGNHFINRGYDFIGEYIDSDYAFSYNNASAIGGEVLDLFTKAEIDEVYLVYNQFMSASTQKPTVKKLLPFEIDEEEKSEDFNLDFEPEPVILLEKLIPEYINFTIFNAVMESLAGEHSARMIAMDSASNNASEMLDQLNIEMNIARQTGITIELLDIINGANALN